jgi:hypothetical protein
MPLCLGHLRFPCLISRLDEGLYIHFQERVIIITSHYQASSTRNRLLESAEKKI